MNEVRIFEHDSFGQVRVINEENKPLFCAIDVAKILGYSNQSDAILRHCKGVVKRDTLTDGGIQKASYIPESDVYRLVMRSKLPEAERFQDWVCEDILPSIRKTGGYMLTTENDTPDTIMAKAILIAQQKINEQEQRIANQSKQIEEAAPKVLFADAVATSRQSCLISELAKLLKQNGIDIGQNRLFIFLRKRGYLGSKGEYYNAPTQRSMEMGLFEIKKTAINKPDGTIITSSTTKVTGKGQIYFVNKFLTSWAI